MRFIIPFSSEVLFALFSTIFGNFEFVQSQIHFEFRWGNELIEQHKSYYFNGNKDSVNIEELSLYLSHIKIQTKDQEFNRVVHLIKFNDPSSFKIMNEQLPGLKSISFYVGLDSTLNTNMDYSGDLDPIHGMYWAWHTGYIHFKLVGKSSNSGHPKNLIDYHLGGYKDPYNTGYPIQIDHVQSKLYLDLLPMFEKKKLDASKEHQIVIPGKEAKKIVYNLKDCFGHD